MRREFGGLDILVNNAGATKRGDFLELTDADWEDGYALKFFAHMRLARAAWPLLKERRGSLVSIGGTGGRKPTAEFTIGSSVNAAVAAFTKCLADRGKTDGVQVNCIHPSVVETDRHAAAHQGRDRTHRTSRSRKSAPRSCREFNIIRFGTVEDVGNLVTFIVSSRATLAAWRDDRPRRRRDSRCAADRTSCSRRRASARSKSKTASSCRR